MRITFMYTDISYNLKFIWEQDVNSNCLLFIFLQLNEAKEEIEKTMVEKDVVIEKLTAKQETLSELQNECERLKPFEVCTHKNI